MLKNDTDTEQEETQAVDMRVKEENVAKVRREYAMDRIGRPVGRCENVK